MSFFPGYFSKKNKVYSLRKKSALQVRIPCNKWNNLGKRALSATFLKITGQMLRRCRSKASITVEAAWILPLFIFFSVTLMFPIEMINESRKVQTLLESACQQASQYAVLFVDGENYGEIEGLKRYKEEFSSAAAVGAFVEAKVRQGLKNTRIKGISFLKSNILEDGETLDFIAEYKISLPFSIFGMAEVTMTSRSRRRIWIGDSKEENGEHGTHWEGEERLVYIGRESSRYHTDRYCHYLYNDLKPVSFDDAEKLRNSDGKRYRCCQVCGEKAKSRGIAYILPSGEAYHGSRYCSSLAAYVKAVPLDQVSSLGPCSYCSAE